MMHSINASTALPAINETYRTSPEVCSGFNLESHDLLSFSTVLSPVFMMPASSLGDKRPRHPSLSGLSH